MPPKKKKEVKEPNVQVPDGDKGKGKMIFQQLCTACHALAGDSKGAAAPTLGGIYGRPVGATNFGYSKTMKNGGFSWTDKFLYVYLKTPGKFLPGNKMSFAGIASDQQRADLIAYLKQI